ncbi:hypothetical protein NDU88_005059 [Pleurodeles waltl]|uniref:Uncharacterized protein n=1 Tax=Pleurodeles waltl TaxID=8319 RepID=A0AAV7QJP1_PLEWA|nr:hypothetical protein NDU88_005059 [Pleurodeles waltl]
MDTKISDLSAESRAIHTDIAGFQDKVTDMVHCLALMEDKLMTPNRDQELQYLWDKLTDLENQSRRDSVHFFGFLKRAEGTINPTQWIQIERILLHSPQGLDLLYGDGDTRVQAAHLVVQAKMTSWQCLTGVEV